MRWPTFLSFILKTLKIINGIDVDNTHNINKYVINECTDSKIEPKLYISSKIHICVVKSKYYSKEEKMK